MRFASGTRKVVVLLDNMSVFTTALVVFNGVLLATTMLLVTMSKAEDNFPSTSLSSASSPVTVLLQPFLNFGKLKESVGAFSWSDYLPVSSRGETTSKQASSPPAANPNETSYLDPNGPNVQFILFTRNHTPYNIKMDKHEDLRKSSFNWSNPTKIIIHGFLSSTKEDIFILNRDAYLETGDYNVIGMDWSVLCEFEYFTAMRGAQIAGSTLGTFLNWLIKQNVSHEDIHLVGHSLGAHVSAMGADKVKNGKVARITGLDPAGPGYNEVPTVYRLDPTDANLVDVVHTNVRVLSLSQTQGHIDFYPNGGRFQPGCPNMYDIWTLGGSVECNHGRSYRYFAESIRNKDAFKSNRCTDVEKAGQGQCPIETDVHMGQEETYEPGIYYFKTNDKSPFSMS